MFYSIFGFIIYLTSCINISQSYINTEESLIQLPILRVSADPNQSTTLVFEFNYTTVTIDDIMAMTQLFCKENIIDRLSCPVLYESAIKEYHDAKNIFHVSLIGTNGDDLYKFQMRNDTDDFNATVAIFCSRYELNSTHCLGYRHQIETKYYDYFRHYPIIKSSKETFQTLFTKVYHHCLWELDNINSNSANVSIYNLPGRCSGIGSRVEHTNQLRIYLFELIQKYNIQSLLDAPCGGMAWMPLLLNQIMTHINPSFYYTGIDIVDHVIQQVSQEFQHHKNWNFLAMDITTQTVNDIYDLVIVRDLFFHLTHDNIKCVINNIKLTNSIYLFATTHDFYNNYTTIITTNNNNNTTTSNSAMSIIKENNNRITLNGNDSPGRSNIDIDGGQYVSVTPFRLIDLTLSPFYFPPPLEVYAGESPSGTTKSSESADINSNLESINSYRMGLWRLSDIPYFTVTEAGEDLSCSID